MFSIRNMKVNETACEKRVLITKATNKNSGEPAHKYDLTRAFAVSQTCSWNRQTKTAKKEREKSRECHNHKPQPIPDIKRKRKQTKPNKRKSKKKYGKL